MCNPKNPNIECSKLSDYDNLCGRVSERYNLRGFYRAFMSTSTQWLANLFDGVCINAKIMNTHVRFSVDVFVIFSILLILRNKFYSIHSKKYSNENHRDMKY